MSASIAVPHSLAFTPTLRATLAKAALMTGLDMVVATDHEAWSEAAEFNDGDGTRH